MGRHMPYVQVWKGSFRFRRRVPDDLREIVGKSEWVAALATKDKAEANRLVVPHIERTDRIIADAERGDYPPIAEDRIESIVFDWWLWFCKQRAARLNVAAGLIGNGLDSHAWALTGDKELTDLVAQFIKETALEFTSSSGPFDKIKQRCKQFHHEIAYGYLPEIDDRLAAAKRIWQEKDDQLAALLDGKPIASKGLGNPKSDLPNPPYRFSTMIADWARERNVTEKTRYGFERIIKKLVQHIGHDDAAAVADTDLIAWKDSLVEARLHSKTIKNHLMVLKTLYNLAEVNKRVAPNPAAHIKYQTKSDKLKRLAYTEDDAKQILEAARHEKSPHLRWVPWLTAFTGARLEEICGAMVADVEAIDGIPCLHIRLDNRQTGASLKNDRSERTVPLHPAIVDEGFLAYVKTLPTTGPLFPNVTPDRFGKRGGNGTKTIGRWVRRKVGITDPRKAPNHSWRHRYKSICRKAGIEEEIHDYLTGHSSGGRVGRDYGDYGLEVLFGAIDRLKSPA